VPAHASRSRRSGDGELRPTGRVGQTPASRSCTSCAWLQRLQVVVFSGPDPDAAGAGRSPPRRGGYEACATRSSPLSTVGQRPDSATAAGQVSFVAAQSFQSGGTAPSGCSPKGSASSVNAHASLPAPRYAQPSPPTVTTPPLLVKNTAISGGHDAPALGDDETCRAPGVFGQVVHSYRCQLLCATALRIRPLAVLTGWWALVPATVVTAVVPHTVNSPDWARCHGVPYIAR